MINVFLSKYEYMGNTIISGAKLTSFIYNLLKCSVNNSLYTLVIKKFKHTSNDLGTTTLIELRKKWKLSKFLQTETTEMVIRFTG